MTAVNLTALAEARTKMTSGEWSVLIGFACTPHDDEACGIASSEWRETRNGRDEAVFRSDAYDECSHPITRGDAAGIVAEHNAIGVLIEVVRTLLVYNAAKREAARCREQWSRDWNNPVLLATHQVADRSLLLAAKDHEAALAKVSL